MTSPRTGYCAVTDLLIGDIPLPSYISPEQVVGDAADEIDSCIGFIYQTPVDVSDNGPTARPVMLLLKRINSHLASGRLLHQLDASGEQVQLHAYATSLVKNASAALESIEKGDIILDGVPTVEGHGDIQTGPLLYNEDVESNVEAFYNRISNPCYFFSPPWIPNGDNSNLIPGGLVRGR